MSNVCEVCGKELDECAWSIVHGVTKTSPQVNVTKSGNIVSLMPKDDEDE